MKRKLLVFLSFAMVLLISLALLSCGEDEPSNNDGSTSSSAPVKSEAPASSKSEAAADSSQSTDNKPDENDKIDYMKYKFFVANDFDTELYSIGVQKGNTALLDEINSVIDLWVENGTLKDYIDYYTNLDLYLNGKIDKMPEPSEVKTSWDFKDATEVITVYTSSGFAPFEFVVGGEIVGVDIAIMSQVAENLGKCIEIKDVEFDNVVFAAASHQGEAVAAAAIVENESRKQYLDFSEIYSEGNITIASKDSRYKCIEELQPLRIGAVQEYIRDYQIVDSVITVYHTVEEAFVSLEKGYVDALVFMSYSCFYASQRQEP